MNQEEMMIVLSACAILINDGEEVAKKLHSEGDILKAKYIVDFLKTLPSPSPETKLFEENTLPIKQNTST